MKGLHILFEGDCTVLCTSLNCHTVIFIEEIIYIFFFFTDNIYFYLSESSSYLIDQANFAAVLAL